MRRSRRGTAPNGCVAAAVAVLPAWKTPDGRRSSRRSSQTRPITVFVCLLLLRASGHSDTRPTRRRPETLCADEQLTGRHDSRSVAEPPLGQPRRRPLYGIFYSGTSCTITFGRRLPVLVCGRAAIVLAAAGVQ